MKIVVTADLHLTSRKEHPERFLALENILSHMLDHGIHNIVIAGDLFHIDLSNYNEFDQFCKNQKYEGIQFHILPGNHDAQLKSSMFTTKNIVVYSKSEIKKFDLLSIPLLFLPYKKDKTMGECIIPFLNELNGNQWILISHGDWIAGMRDPNPYEPGVYMPLTRPDIEQYKPLRVILGHIHKPMNGELLVYPGSPSPLDINETGKRRFLILDTETGSFEIQTVDSEVVYFNEKMMIIPIDDKANYIKSKAQELIRQWDLGAEEIKKTEIRIKVYGFTSNKREIDQLLREYFREFKFYKDEGPDLSEVHVTEDIERAEIAKQVVENIKHLDLPKGEYEPDGFQVTLEALNTVYGVS